MTPSNQKELPIEKAVEYLLEECRMVLPGIQALFGFQLIAVFNSAFDEKLPTSGRIVHLIAIAFTAFSVALVMAPASIHRQSEPKQVSEDFLLLSSRLLLYAMAPLSLSICLDFYLITGVIVKFGMIAV